MKRDTGEIQYYQPDLRLMRVDILVHLCATKTDIARFEVVVDLYMKEWPTSQILQEAARRCGVEYDTFRQWWARFRAKVRERHDQILLV